MLDLVVLCTHLEQEAKIQTIQEKKKQTISYCLNILTLGRPDELFFQHLGLQSIGSKGKFLRNRLSLCVAPRHYQN